MKHEIWFRTMRYRHRIPLVKNGVRVDTSDCAKDTLGSSSSLSIRL
jgi:hypothetical protein